MNSKERNCAAAICVLLASCLWVMPVAAQTADMKDKPPMYTYVSNFNIPRAHWPDMEKQAASNNKLFETAIANGTLVGYGNDVTLVHQPEGYTHDSWWSSMSQAGLMNILDELTRNGTTTNPVLAGATKHSDSLYVSRHYNWHPGSWKGAYTRSASFKLKADAPNDAVATLSKSFIVPMMEKLLADGTLLEYEIDEQAVHTDAPGMFVIVFITPKAEGLDKASAALTEALKANPLSGSALTSMVDFSAHRDDLARTTATYK